MGNRRGPQGDCVIVERRTLRNTIRRSEVAVDVDASAVDDSSAS
jgi:hypothetical protein